MRRSQILPVLSAEEMRRVDAYTIGKCGIAGVELMGRAGEAVFEEFSSKFPLKTTYFMVFCGLGNNGGDGFAFTEKCWKEGYRNFKLFAASDREGKEPTSDSSFYLKRLREMGVEPERISQPSDVRDEGYAVKIDALFGTGLASQLSPFYKEVIDRFNSIKGYTICVDCPSGMNATTGLPQGASVKADLTVTMGYPKSGFFVADGSELAGELAIHDIGLKEYSEAGLTPRKFHFPIEFFTANPIPSRRKGVHKGDFGRVLIVAGSRGFSGAAKLAGTSALRAGAGLVRLFVPFEIYEVLAQELTEVMVDCFLPYGFSESSEGLGRLAPHLEWADVLAIGSGLSERYELQETAFSILEASTLPFVADAEGTLSAKRWAESAYEKHNRLSLLTPHLGELSKLVGKPTELVIREPETIATGLSQELGMFILAKSATSFLATPEGIIVYPPQGSPSLAKGGSGDVLTGAIAARVAIALKSAESDEIPYEGDYLTESYFAKFPQELVDALESRWREEFTAHRRSHCLAFVEGIMRGYYLFAEASRFAVDLYGDEEMLLAGEIADLIDAEDDTDDSGSEEPSGTM